MKYITTKEFAVLAPIQVAHKEFEKTSVMKSNLEHCHILFQKKLTLSGKKSYSLKIIADDYYKLYVNQKFVAMGPAGSYASHPKNSF